MNPDFPERPLVDAAPTPTAGPTRVRWMIFALACGTSFVLYLHRYTWGIVKKDVGEEFGWSEFQLGWLDGAFSASYGFGQIPSGVLCDWFGPHLLLGTIIISWSLAMGAVAVAVGYVSMISARIAFGLTQAGCYPTLSKVTKLWFPLSVRTSVQGWIATFFGRGGGAVSFVLVGTVLLGWLELSWREALVVLTVAGCLFGVLFILLFRNTPKDHPWANDAETELVTEGIPEVSQATRTKLKWSAVLKSGNLRFFFLQQFTSAFADNVYVYWIPLFLLTAKSVDMKSAGWMSAVPLVGGAIGGMLGGILQNYLILRTGNRRWSRSSIGLIGKFLATVFIFVSLAFNEAVWIVSIFFVVKFFSDWSQPTVWGTITDIAGPGAASLFGANNTFGSVAGFLAGPLMGLTIMTFSDRYPAPEETVGVESTEQIAERSSIRTTFAPLQRMNVAPGSLSGEVYRDDEPIYTFRVTEKGEFEFTPTAATRLPSTPAATPIAPRCRLNRVRGVVTIEWDPPPGRVPGTDRTEPDSQSPVPRWRLVVDYDYIDYTNGWSTLFIALGGIYLISSLCWLFIDCTVPLEPDATH